MWMMKQSGKQATPNSLKVPKSKTGDINFCEDLSVMGEEFSQHRFDAWQLFLFLRYITSANISFCVRTMLCVQLNGLNLLVAKEKNFPIILGRRFSRQLEKYRRISFCNCNLFAHLEMRKNLRKFLGFLSAVTISGRRQCCWSLM